MSKYLVKNMSKVVSHPHVVDYDTYTEDLSYLGDSFVINKQTPQKSDLVRVWASAVPAWNSQKNYAWKCYISSTDTYDCDNNEAFICLHKKEDILSLISALTSVAESADVFTDAVNAARATVIEEQTTA